MDSNSYRQSFGPPRSPLRTNHPIAGAAGANLTSVQRGSVGKGHQQNSIDLSSAASRPLRVFSAGGNEEEEEYERRRQQVMRAGSQMLQPKLRPQSSAHNSASRVSGTNREQHHQPSPQQLRPVHHLGSSMPHHIREHIQHLQQDNAGLLRRLNAVHQELDRLNREKGDLQAQYTHFMAQATEAYDLLQQDDNVDKVNMYMKDDLQYEKERNAKVRMQIEDINHQINSLREEQRRLEDEQEFMIRQNQETSYSLQKTLGDIADLEKEQYFNAERLRDSALNIDQYATECQHDEQDKHNLRQEVEFVMTQRADVIDRTNQVSRDFEITIAQISEERKIMEINNSSQAKAITAKLLFNCLQEIYNNKLLQGFQEIHQYTKFDNKCNLKLKIVANLLEKAGRAKQKIAVTHWFSSALKPTEVIEQKKQISAQSDRLKSVSQFYQLWRKAFMKQIESYDQKTQAIQRIWNKLTQDTTIEKKRALRIWKEALKRFKIQKFRLRRILWKKFFKQAGIAFNGWQNHNSYFDSQVRLNLLAQSYSYQQQMAILFRLFHLETQNSKRKRLQTLAHCIKGWRDYLNHQKYLMSQNILASHFKIECQTNLVQACFDAMKLHKQKELYLKTEQSLSNEFSSIHSLTHDNCRILQERHRLNQLRALTTVATCQRKRLWSYLGHWRQVNVDHHEAVRTTLTDKLIKLYHSWLRVAFSRWQLRDDQESTRLRKERIADYQAQNRQTQNEIIDQTNDNRAKQDERAQIRQRQLTKCINAYEKRRVQIATGRWRDQVMSMNVKENGASIITRRLRLRYCRMAFELYKEGLKFRRTNIQQEKRCALYNQLRNQRLLNQVLNAWLIFKNQHQEAKKAWYCIFLKLEVSFKRLSIKKWRESTQVKAEKSLDDHSNHICDTVQSHNNQIGQLQFQEERQQFELNQQNKLLTTQGQRILATAFARFYHINQTRGFEKWKDFTAFTKQRESLLNKVTSHIRKSQFYVVKSSFKNWILYADIAEKQDLIKKELQRIQDTTFQQTSQFSTFTSDSLNLNQAIEQEKGEQELISKKHSNVIKLIVAMVHKNHSMARKRFIFEQWGQYVKREVYFINCIKNVLQKSLWNTGLQAIKQAAREDQLNNKRDVVLTKFFQLFQKSVLYNGLSKWRSINYHTCRGIIHKTLVETQVNEEKHQTRIDLVKTHNANRAFKLLTDFHKKNVIQAWRNSITFLKLQKANTLLLRTENNATAQCNALQLWKARNQQTKQVRTTVQRIREKVRTSTLKQCYKALKCNFFHTKELLNRLSNITRVVDHQVIQSGFVAIRSFAKAKHFAQAKRKENASIWLGEALTDIVKRRKHQNLTEFKLRCQNKRNREFLQRLVGNLAHGNKMRSFFLRWKENSNQVSLATDLYETGPVREQDYHYKSELRNIKDLMKNEGYDDEDTGKALNQHNQEKRQLMLKAIRRMQHFNSELYAKPKMFDQWKRYVHVKRLYKYWLQFVEKRAQIVKSDKHYVFDRWKKFHPVKHTELTCLSKQNLGKRAVDNNKALDQLAEQIHSKESIVDHLNAQRDTLLDNYIKAQRLALALCQAQQRHSLHQAFSQWMDEQKRRKNMDYSIHLRSNLQQLEALKARVKSLEADNETYANENEELRQFTIDGYDIAKTVQVLSSEREILSVDLADKAQVIRKLLDENESLTKKLEKAQDRAQSLIRATMRREPAGNTGLYSSGITRR